MAEPLARILRRCTGLTRDGRACGMTPLRDSAFCFRHDPEKADEAAEASRLGGFRRRREKVLSGAFDYAGLATVEDVRRILEVALLDSLALENSIPRNRLLVTTAMAAARLLDIGDLEGRVVALEASRAPLVLLRGSSLLDDSPDDLDFAVDEESS